MQKNSLYPEKPTQNMERIALGIEYEGTRYAGWQRQKHAPSVQAHLEKAISNVANTPIQVFCAGRTDAGVHACGQIIHFDTPISRCAQAWIKGVNAHLPRDIRVCWQKKVSTAFDARKSALSRRYCYVILNRPVPSGILHAAFTWIHKPLAITPMQKAAAYLIGTHDFSSFRAAFCQAKTPIRTIYSLEIKKKADTIIIDILANAFLYHMVRNIVGALMGIGHQRHSVEWMLKVLQAKDRRQASCTAPAQGLYLVDVQYPVEFGLPRMKPSMEWFF